MSWGAFLCHVGSHCNGGPAMQWKLFYVTKVFLCNV